jgi:thiol-disulfide isomerase/thioredoxin
MSDLIVSPDAQTFETAILRSWNEESGAKSFVLFSSPNCVPCERVKRTVEQLEEDLKKTIGFVSVHHAVAAASQTQIRSVPTLVKFERGKESARIVGERPLAELEAFLRS